MLVPKPEKGFMISQKDLLNIKFPQKGEIWLVDYTSNFEKEFEIESKVKKLRPSLIQVMIFKMKSVMIS